jgi:tRNA/rRNA methyltransferase
MNVFVSFPLKCVIDLVPAAETPAATQARAEKRVWLVERGYNVVEIKAGDVEADVANVLNQLEIELSAL